jgi:hypothetical protein
MFTLDKISKQSTFFSDSQANKTFQSDEEKMLCIIRNNKSINQYNRFDSDFSTYLQKLPSGIVKNKVSDIITRKIIYLAVAKNKLDNVFSKVVITDNKLSQILLSTQQLNIDPETGITKSIDECVYSTYFSLIRAAIIINKKEIRQDINLHKLLTTYLYLLFLKAIGSDKLYNDKQKTFVHILSIYLFYKCYLKEKHDFILSIIRRDYGSFVNKTFFEEFVPTLDELKNYDSIKDFPKMLIDAKILNIHPNIIIIQLLKMLNPMGFYCLIGPFDYFIAMVILSKYPIEFISKGALINEKLQTSIEELIIKYIDKINYEI